MRVSTGEQSLNLQRDALARTGCERIYDDVCSGRATDRPGLSKALDAAREGDALVVWKLDRIGRSLPHVVGLVGDLLLRRRGKNDGAVIFGAVATPPIELLEEFSAPPHRPSLNAVGHLAEAIVIGLPS